ncbi:MAG: hypothetical protein AB1813_17595 [Verrucomicrobiota bacterium]
MASLDRIDYRHRRITLLTSAPLCNGLISTTPSTAMPGKNKWARRVHSPQVCAPHSFVENFVATFVGKIFDR